MTTIHGLGRRSDPDPRDLRYPLAQLVRRVPTAQWRYWPFPYPQPLDQGATGTCVGHGWKHDLMCAPGRTIGPSAEPTAFRIYREACHEDVWFQNDNEDLNFGTSVRAGAIALQKRGIITNYYWSTSIDDAVNYMLAKGPLVIGVNWYSDMFEPTTSGFIRVGGAIEGGHCLLAVGVNRISRRIRLLNSWGPWWGQWGRAWISFDDFERLMGEDGEICAATEPRRP